MVLLPLDAIVRELSGFCLSNVVGVSLEVSREGFVVRVEVERIESKSLSNCSEVFRGFKETKGNKCKSKDRLNIF